MDHSSCFLCFWFFVHVVLHGCAWEGLLLFIFFSQRVHFEIMLLRAQSYIKFLIVTGYIVVTCLFLRDLLVPHGISQSYKMSSALFFYFTGAL